MAEYTIVIQGACRPCSVRLELDAARPNEKNIIDFIAIGVFYDADVAEVFARVLREGDTVIDVGANIGFFTLLAAAIVGPTGRVVSFEPDPANFARLRANVEANGFRHVTLIDRPVAEKPGPVSFFINSDDSGGSALWDPASFPGNVRSQATRQILALDATTIDSEVERLGLSSVRLLKVDTEGADHLVLRGARRLLARRGVPFVVAELHELGMERMHTNQHAFRAEMAAAGYDLFLLYLKGVLPRLVPAATTLGSVFLTNVLFSSADAVGNCWPSHLHDPRIG